TGYALLAHEAAHVLQAMTPNAAWRRATQAGADEEEHEAAAVERAAQVVARQIVVPSAFSPARAVVRPEIPERAAPPGRGAAVPAAPSEPSFSLASAGATPVFRPMNASVDRPTTDAPPSPRSDAPNFETLRQQLFR